MNLRHKQREFEPYWYIAPALIITLGVLIFPLIFATVLSLVRWDLIRPDLKLTFVGIGNYIKVLSSRAFRDAIQLTLFFTVALVTFELIIGFGIALMLQCRFWGRGVIRSLIILPMVITPVVAGLIFRSLLFNASFGLINYFLSLFGISAVSWLAGVGTVRFTVFISSLWLKLPFTTLILLSGLESLPMDIYEAAAIDGATPIQRFRLITLPLLKPTIFVAVIFRTIYSLRLFEIPWIIAGGGPGTSTQTLSILAYKQSMQFFRMGKGASTAMITLMITLIFVLGYIRMIRRDSLS